MVAEARRASGSTGSKRGPADERDTQTHPGDQLPPGQAGKGGPRTLTGAVKEEVPSPEAKYKGRCFRSRYLLTIELTIPGACIYTN